MLKKTVQGAILLLWATRKPHSTAEVSKPGFFPQYLQYDYGIMDPYGFYLKLKEKGLYRKARMDEVLSSLTASKLKDLLSARNLKKSGAKEELIERCARELPKEDLQGLLDEEYYTLSDGAIEVILKNQILIDLRQYPEWNLTYEEFIENQKKCPPGFSDRDVLWRIFNSRVTESIQKMNWIGIRESYLALAEVSLKYDGNEHRAVSFWATTLFFDMNAAKQLQWDAMVAGRPSSEFLNERSIGNIICFPPALIETLKKYADILETIPAEKIIKPPAKIFDNEDYQNIIEDIVSENPFDLRGWENACRIKSILWARSLK